VDKKEPVRKIIHVDMDMFYAAVEIRDNPDLAGRPLVVGGSPRSRAVVTTASYEARKYGIRSAMSCAEALRRCPVCLFIPPDFEKYRRVSKEIREIFFRYTSLVEPVSLDEAYLDVTRNHSDEPSATRIARAIKKEILETTGLTASAGVASCRFVAKIASDYHKPDGLTVVPPERVLAFIQPLPVRKIPGIGRVTAARLASLGVATVRDLAGLPLEELLREFGKFGQFLHGIARGIDRREIVPHRERKSISVEDTFQEDTLDLEFLSEFLKRAADRVFEILRREGKEARTVTLKVKYEDFTQVTRRRTLDHAVRSPEEIHAVAMELLQRTEAGRRKVRLAGVGLSSFVEEGPEEGARQLTLQVDLPGETSS